MVGVYTTGVVVGKETRKDKFVAAYRARAIARLRVLDRLIFSSRFSSPSAYTDKTRRGREMVFKFRGEKEER